MKLWWQIYQNGAYVKDIYADSRTLALFAFIDSYPCNIGDKLDAIPLAP